MKLSIAIPTWEAYGKGDYYLRDLFFSLTKQTFKDFEVCVSDHSKNDKIFSVCEEYSDELDIKYFKNEENRGNGTSNANSALEMCEGDIIKIMFQDDIFFSTTCLHSVYTNLNKSKKSWLVSGCNHTINNGNSFYNEMFPKWNSDILKGVNTISSPSVLSIKKEVKNRFDETLTMMMDCEYYFALKQEYGDPLYLNEIHVTNRVHRNQVSQVYSRDANYQEKISNEIEYCVDKYKQ